MIGIKDQVLREFGDHGADTLHRYFAQIEYTVFWCIRMLRDAEGIKAVIPEGVEDVVVIQRGVYKLHQVKTRDESQGPWTTADVLPLLCQQYHRRNAFSAECCYHFVSNQIADSKAALRTGSYGALYRLKSLLDIKHDGQSLTSNEQADLAQLAEAIIPRIRDVLLSEHGEDIDNTTAQALLHKTWIETDCPRVHYPSDLAELDPNNLYELELALAELLPGTPAWTVVQLRRMYERLLLLVLRQIILGNRLATRQINLQDVLDCRTASETFSDGYPDLDSVPGRTLLEKKLRLGGFDPTELPVFYKQKELAQWPIRRLESLGLATDLQRLTTAILDLQQSCRHKICREQRIDQQPGPTILSMLRPGLTPLATKYFPGSSDVDDQFCQGVLWQETDLCSIWWHGLKDFSQEMTS